MQDSIWQIENIPQELREYFEPVFEAKSTQQGCGGDFPIDDKGRERDRFKVVARNPHPTVKPIELTKWLATLLLPPPEYAPRRILIPFCGTMSEGIGAGLAGWEEIVGIDITAEYCAIARARLAHWLAVIQQEMF